MLTKHALARMTILPVCWEAAVRSDPVQTLHKLSRECVCVCAKAQTSEEALLSLCHKTQY